MKNSTFIILTSLILFALSGCEKTTTEKTAYGDAFIKSIKNDAGETVYALVNSVFSYDKMTSATVTTPGGNTTSLISDSSNGLSYYNVVTDEDYSSTIPSVGTYSYEVTFDGGEEESYTNTLTTSSLLPANITSLVQSADQDSVYLSWDAIASVDFYQIKIISGTKVVYYIDGLHDYSSPQKSSLEYGFLKSSLTSVGGTGTYTVILSGLLYESTSYTYLQAISSSSADIEL